MRSVESEGATIDEAIARALAALGAERERVAIDILESGSPGFLGIGRRKARVRATMRVPLREWLEGTATEEPSRPAPAPEPVRPPSRHALPENSRRGTAREDLSAGAADSSVPATSGAGTERGARILREILRLMGLDATVTASPREGGVQGLEIRGPGSADVVGRRGEVLEALEYVVNRMGEAGGQPGDRFVLDAAGYRARRRGELESLARRLAERARRRGKPVTASALSPNDRRTVYQVLATERGVSARSLGQGFYRKLVITPEGARRGGGKAGG